MPALTAYEAACITEPGYSRGSAAGICYEIRRRLAEGRPFASSRDAALELYQRRIVELQAGGWDTRNPTLPWTSAGITGP